MRAKLLIHRSGKLGYRASETAVVDAMDRSRPSRRRQVFAGGARGRLSQAGIPEAAYEEQLGQDLQRQQLMDGIRNSNFLTPRSGTG